MSTTSGRDGAAVSADATRSFVSRRRRSTLTVSIDLDPVPGWGNTTEDHRAHVKRLLDQTVGHYNPTVEVSECIPDALTEHAARIARTVVYFDALLSGPLDRTLRDVVETARLSLTTPVAAVCEDRQDGAS